MFRDKRSAILEAAARMFSFAAVCADVGERIVEAAKAAIRTEKDLAERVTAVLAAKFTVVFELVQSSPYAEELLRPASAAARENIATADVAFRRVLTELLTSAARSGELDLRGLGLSAPELTTQLMQAGYGASYGASSTDEQRQNLRALVISLLRAGMPKRRSSRRRRS
jgi:hypothetical protein